MKHLRVALLAGAVALSQLPGFASAKVCSVDWRPGGGDNVRFWLKGVAVQRPSTVKLEYFGSWQEIVIYDLAQRVILYQGAPTPSFNAVDGITILAFKVMPGVAMRITADWANPPAGCS